MWSTPTRVLKSTACLLAVLCFVFVRTTTIVAQSEESVAKACGEIFHVCISGVPELLIEGKPHKPSKISRVESSIDARICLKLVDEVGHKFQQSQRFSKTLTVMGKHPIWLVNQALLI